MTQFKFITLTLIFLSVFSVNAQQKLQKTPQSVKANKDLTLNLNTSHTNIEIDTWNKNEVKIESYIESKELTKEELQDILDRWNVEVKGSGDNISISTSGEVRDSWNFDFNFEFDDEALKALEELQFVMADLPKIPEIPEMPEIPEIDFKTPVLPEMPELPELPEGVNNVNFDFDTYQKEGEAYLEKWSKEYEAKYGKVYKDKMKAWAKEFSKTDFDKYSKEMEAWGEKFGKEYEAKMEIWSKKMDGKWAKEMEVWGEKFEEEFGKEFEERMEARTKALEKRLEKHEERQLIRLKELEKRAEAREKRSIHLKKRLESSRSGKVIKTIKIKMPKGAKLKVNVRHGELKFASIIHNLKADLSHATLVATRIDGSETSINASYSPVIVSNWNSGELKLNYVKSAELKIVNQLTLKSNSSNIVVEELIGKAIINGSFGNLEINKIADSFNNLNLVLENSDAFVTLPKTNYNLQIQGTYSTFKRLDKTISSENSSSDKTIVINAKYSNVTMQ